MFNFLSWNVRGLNNPVKRALVKSLVVSCKGSVLCIQETKVGLISRSFLRSFVGSRFDKCHYISSAGASGGIATCWNARDFACLEVLVRNYSLTLRLKHFSSGTVFFLTNVYGPPPRGKGRKISAASSRRLRGFVAVPR